MLFAINCKDKEGALDVRMANRADHLRFIEELGDQVKAGGPFTDDNGEMNGSMIIIEANNRQDIEAIAARDPYAKAGLFQSVEITAWKWLIKNPETA